MPCRLHPELASENGPGDPTKYSAPLRPLPVHRWLWLLQRRLRKNHRLDAAAGSGTDPFSLPDATEMGQCAANLGTHFEVGSSRAARRCFSMSALKQFMTCRDLTMLRRINPTCWKSPPKSLLLHDAGVRSASMWSSAGIFSDTESTPSA